jgi:hypothetical protein
MNPMALRAVLVATALAAGSTLLNVGCESTDDKDAGSDSGGGTTGGSTAGDSGTTTTLCEDIGGGAGKSTQGAAAIDSVMDAFVVKLATDCKIQKFFTTLTAARLGEVDECLKVQVKEAFGCTGAKYEGFKTTSGHTCLDMKTSHTGLGISTGDYNALLENLLAVLPPSVKESPKFTPVATLLTSDSFKADIVEAPSNAGNTKATCDAGTTDSLTDSGSDASGDAAEGG